MTEKTYYLTKEQFETVKATWKKSSHPAWAHIIYNILRGKKPSNGFCAKTKNIQGNDPWYGYTCAKNLAQSKCCLDNMWESYKDHPTRHFWYEIGVREIESRQKKFVHMFGIDIPDDILSRFEENA